MRGKKKEGREGGRGKGKGGERGEDVEGPGKWSARGPCWLSAGLIATVLKNINSVSSCMVPTD